MKSKLKTNNENNLFILALQTFLLKLKLVTKKKSIYFLNQKINKSKELCSKKFVQNL